MIGSLYRDLNAQDVAEQIVGLVVLALFGEDGSDAFEDGSDVGVVHPVGITVQAEGLSIKHHCAVEVPSLVVDASDHDKGAGNRRVVAA